MDSFLDTNVPLAYVFSIEPINITDSNVLKTYDKYYWSDNVRIEFDYRFDQKQTTLSSFFNDFQYNVEKSHRTYFTKGIMKKFANNWDYTSKKTKR